MSAIQETDVLREWRESARHWERHAPTIRLMFAPVTHALIEEAGIAEGHKVLDVAGGPGEPSLAIAEVVGPSGSVTCTDAIVGMVLAAESEGRRRGLTNVEFRQCTADSLPFQDNSFDAAVSRLGVMFFPDPLAGLREMLRVTKPGGAVSTAVWHKSEFNPFSFIVTNVISTYFKASPPEPGGPDAFRFAEPGALAAVLREAGARSVRERLLKFHIEAPISPAEFWAMRSETSSSLREKLTKVASEVKEQIGEDVQKAAREFFPNNQMKFPAQMIIVSGKKSN